MLDQDHQTRISDNAAQAYFWWGEAGKVAYQNQIDLNRPHVVLKPHVFPDGDKWIALYGENIQEGVCGTGDTPEKACAAFDTAWTTSRAMNPPATTR